MGVVTGYEWANPHSILSVAVKDEKGVQQWHAEILPPTEMLRGRVDKSVRPGDEVIDRPSRQMRSIICGLIIW